MYQKKQRRKRVRSRKESFDVGFSTYNTRYTKPRNYKDYQAPNYRYAFSENYKTLEKLIHDSKFAILTLILVGKSLSSRDEDIRKELDEMKVLGKRKTPARMSLLKKQDDEKKRNSTRKSSGKKLHI